MADGTLEIAGDTITAWEWNAKWSLYLGQVGTANVVVQDRSNDPTLIYGNTRQSMRILIGGTPAWAGEITDSGLALPNGFPWRRWELTGSDWMTALDLRVNAIAGDSWVTDPGATEPYPISAFPANKGDDEITVQDMFTALVASASISFDTSTHVYNWIPGGVLNDGSGNPRVSWQNTTVRSMLDELRGYGAFAIYLGLWPDGKVIWLAFPPNEQVGGGTVTIAAPADLTDDNPDGSSTVGFRDLKLSLTTSYAPEEVYVNGATDFIYNSGSVVQQGTGWGGGSAPSTTKRAIIVDGQSVNTDARDALADAYKALGATAQIRGSVRIGSRPDEIVDGWLPGQMFTLTDARLPDDLNGQSWPIMAVHGEVVEGHKNFRGYVLEFGSAPLDRFSQRFRSTAAKVQTRPRQPARVHLIYHDPTLRPSSTYTVTSQAVDNAKAPVRQSGIPVTWALEVKDISGATIMEGSLSPTDAVTNQDGQTFTELTTGATVGTYYNITAVTAAQ